MYKTPTEPELTLDVKQECTQCGLEPEKCACLPPRIFEYVVTLAGDHIKELHRGVSEEAAQKVYDGVKYDYKVNYPKDGN